VSVVREAIVLPLLFLTVVLVGGVRPGSAITVAPPSVGALVAAMLLLALLVRSGTFAPDVVLNAGRPMLANINGLVLLLSVFAASAQVIMLVVPESGVPALIVWVALVTMLIQALAIGPDRVRMLRGLLVTFGAAFILKFVVLAALSVPAEGRFSRLMQVLFEGVTLGTVAQRAPHATEGYLAFAVVVLYLVGVALLPSAGWQMIQRPRTAAELPDVSPHTPQLNSEGRQWNVERRR
jgi:hypothetical protein